MILSDFKVIAVKQLFFSLNQINWLGSDCKTFWGQLCQWQFVEKI